MTQQYFELVDPDGETYSDGSQDLIISGEYPGTFCSDPAHTISLHFGGCDVDIDERGLEWLIKDGGPKLLAALRKANSQTPVLAGAV